MPRYGRRYGNRYGRYRKWSSPYKRGWRTYPRMPFMRVPPVLSVVEKKFFDASIAPATPPQTFSTTWALVDLNGSGVHSMVGLITQGTGDSSRIGRSIWVHSITVRFDIIINTHNSDAAEQHVRFALVMDKQCNAADPAVTDIYLDDDIHSHRNLYNGRRFTVLKEIVMSRDAQAYGNGTTNRSGAKVIPIVCHKEFKTPVRVDYESNTASVSALSRVNFFMMMCTLNSAPTVDIGQTSVDGGRYRIRFTDSPGYRAARYVSFLSWGGPPAPPNPPGLLYSMRPIV